jgi:hypothetical protein
MIYIKLGDKSPYFLKRFEINLKEILKIQGTHQEERLRNSLSLS